MKKLPTLTVALMVLGFVGWRAAGALAWQESPPAEQKKATEAAAEKELKTSDPEAVELITQARNRLFERHSVQATMSQLVTLGSYKFRSAGNYAAAAGFRYRLEYRVQLGDLEGQFLEVCDGQVLHTRRQIGAANSGLISVTKPEIELSRRDIQKIRREALGIKDSNPGTDLSDALRAAEIGIGGLPAILAMLERTLILDPVRPQTVEGREFLVLQGRMRPDRQSELLAGLGPAAGQVAGFMPDLVRVYVNRETLFPEKFLYLKKSGGEQNAFRPIVTVEFTDILLDQPIAEGQFVYMAPPGLEEKDETAQYLENMRQAAQAMTNPAAPATEPAAPPAKP
ncbi:hypothetical protein [Planctomicrobium piriforme]|uniref:Uncharacterized protein n=1 Tax=Planctomicrobium piriforme TaxID=1576369 RepID=A0A1I3IIM8_9PLAN|nr:hypothetical protein [Planctomicrobium piriforme]SFI47834.1 hypothetical protein SAMN05421753_109142 [Planctomicrobium piriforme]